MIPVLALGVFTIFASTSFVWTQTPTPIQSGQAPGKTIVQRIAERFGLNESDVQSVFDQNHQERQAQRQDRMEERLTQLVAEGKLNESQKQAILSKMQELANQKQSQMDNFRNMTRQERLTEMQKKHDEVKSWADSLGIDPSIQGIFGRYSSVPPFGHMMGLKMY